MRSLDFLFGLPNPFSRNMSLGLIQLLTEMSTGIFLWGKAWPVHKVDNFTAMCDPVV
jgi:hypothetical protein